MIYKVEESLYLMDPAQEKRIMKILLFYKKKGYTDAQLKNLLIQKSYPSNIREHLLRKASRHTKFLHLLPYVMLVLVILIILAPFLRFLIPAASCPDELCFIKKANACEYAKFTQTKDGTAFLLSTNNCVLTKKVKTIAADEPPEIRSLLEGKVMKCTYQENNFPNGLATMISQSLNECEGDLRDVIEHLKSSLEET